MAKKKISADTVSNPLADSLFFTQTQAEPEPPALEEAKVEQPSEISAETKKTTPKAKSKPRQRKRTTTKGKASGKVVGTKTGRVGRPRSTRPTVRYSFEFFEDQITELRKIRANQELETGEAVKLSQLVRAALDQYIKKA